MTIKATVGIIGGTGWMGKALAEALLTTQTVFAEQLWIANRSGHNPFAERYPTVHFTTDSQELVEACDVVVLAVLPQQFPALSIQVQRPLVISLMAMVSVDTIRQHCHTSNIVRTMPNAVIPELAAYTPWFADPSVTAADKAIVRALFQCCGTEAEVWQEDHLNFLTALTGSSHGWLAYVAKTLVELGVEHGLDQSLVEPAVRQVMRGVGALIAHEQPSPKETVKILTDYAGSTAAGLLAFDQAKVAEGLKTGILASYERARKPY